MQASLADLVAAHDEVVPISRTVPDRSLEWRPDKDEFSVKQILVHLTHTNDFYPMIIEEAQAADFGIVRLHSESSGWQRMGATDAEAWQCTEVAALYECFERAFQRLLAMLARMADEEIERPFMLYEMQSDVEPLTTTLQRRVVQIAASHLREHQVQLAETLANWQSMQSV